jgi:hypothetical protein
MTGPSEQRMNKGIYIWKSSFCPAFGAGHVTSIASSLQNSLIFSKTQVCLAVSSPGGACTGRPSMEEGCQASET